MLRIEFPEAGLIKAERHYRLYTTAMGRNGTAEIAALEIQANAGWVTLRPVSRRKRVALNCWIEIPRDPATLLRVAMELMRIAGSEGAS